MQVERLRELAALLEGVAADPDRRDRFDMSVWWGQPPEAETGCGTVGCALGWAAKHPPFVAAGLRLSGGSPAYKSPGSPLIDYGVMAGVSFFGLSRDQAGGLFYAATESRRHDPLAVAANVRAMLAEAGHG